MSYPVIIFCGETLNHHQYPPMPFNGTLKYHPCSIYGLEGGGGAAAAEEEEDDDDHDDDDEEEK